jgi:transposase
MLKVVHPICCGVDIHKNFIVATIVSTANSKSKMATYKTKRFSTFNDDLTSFKDWLIEENCLELCMESTGKYWIPVYNVLESFINITLANPKYVRAIKGKKTDKKDSIWIADLHRHGLVPGSYIPPKPVRMLRDICRYRTKLVGNRSSEKNRVQNSLTMCNIALPSVLSDTFGKTAQRIIDYVLTCEKFDPEHCKTLIDSRVKADPDEIIRSILGYNLTLDQVAKIRIANQHLKHVNECLEEVDEEIAKLSKPFQKEISLLSSIPGITDTSATYIISEIGIDMDVFHSSKHLCSWAGLAPQNNESAGKKKSTKISRAGVYLKPLLVQCANAAIKNLKNPYFRDKYLAIKKRRGHKKALIAICRMMLTCVFNMLKHDQEFAPSDLVTSNQSKEMKAKQEKRKIQLAIEYLNRKGFSVAEMQTELELVNSS